MSNNNANVNVLVGDNKVNTQNVDLDIPYINEMKSIYENILAQFPSDLGKIVSKKEREQLKLYLTTLIYGEIDFDSFGLIIQKIKKVYGLPNVGASGPNGFLQHRGGYFYDLGAGIGKPVIAAAVLHGFDYCIGIEILEGLYTTSQQIMQVYDNIGRTQLGRAIDTVVEVKHGDILDVGVKDWRNGDLVFANSTCFDDTLMCQIARIAAGMKRGSFFVTLTKRLPSNDFQILEYEMHEMSWGEATVYIHQKTTEPREIDSDEEN